ncbi:aromatic acid exporter family protein [Cohnella soli]|uniref:Aromatic acid exporter family protein n=1 Tax=Cohnella soli TaxID=425005 RepID=A0ABW0HU79_9BACL
MGIRVIKTAVAALVAIYAAHMLGVANPLSAGILAIMGVDTTRWRGIRAVLARFGASMFGLLFASALFEFIGFHIWVLAIYILLAYPILARTGLKDGIITGSVIVFHLFAAGEVTKYALLTELELLVLGLGSATLFNLAYMPREQETLTTLRVRTEESFSAIFRRLSEHLRDPGVVWSGEEMLYAEKAIEQGIEVARRARENRLIPQDEPWQLYFEMRRQQFESIGLMMESIAFVSSRVPQAEQLSVLFDRLTDDVKSDYYEGETERMLDRLESSFKGMPLPATRDEFEIRAALFQLSRELRRFLNIAGRSKKRKSTSAQAIIQ